MADFVARIRKGLEATDTAHMDVTMSGTGGEMTASGDVDYTVDAAQHVDDDEARSADDRRCCCSTR